jgi:hypothetical protein
MDDREHPRAMLERQQARTKAERPWRKQGGVAATDGDELPDKLHWPRDMGFRVGDDHREDSGYELAYWRKWASDEIKATGGNPAHYRQIADWANAGLLDRMLGPHPRDLHDPHDRTVRNLERRFVAACLLVQLDRVEFRLAGLDRCEMSDEAHDLGHAVASEALAALRDLRELMILRNEKAIVSRAFLQENRAAERERIQRVDALLLREAVAMRRRRPKRTYSSMATDLLKLHSVAEAGYEHGTLRKKLSKLISGK